MVGGTKDNFLSLRGQPLVVLAANDRIGHNSYVLVLQTCVEPLEEKRELFSRFFDPKYPDFSKPKPLGSPHDKE
jgi:hypothetical protein